MEKAAASLRKFLQIVTRYMDIAGVAVLCLMVLMLVYSVIMRKFFSPMNGAGELSEYGLVLVIFLFMAGSYLHRDSMCMDTYVEKLPRKARWSTEVFVQVVNVVILGLVTWRLFVQAVKSDSHSSIFSIPHGPFIYIASVCSVVLTLVYVVYLLEALTKTQKAWRA